MSHEHKKACEEIAELCAKSTQPSQRLLRVYDIAMRSLGMTKNQRDHEIQTLIQRKRDYFHNKQR